MEGTLVLQEQRNVVDNFRNWYKEKLVDTGKTAKFEETIDKRINLERKMIKVAGTAATVILTICPLDGPFGEIAAALATPALVKLVEAKGEIMKKSIIGGKRRIEADYLGVDGKSKKVEIPDGNIVENIVQFKKSAEEIAEKGKEKWTKSKC